MTRRAFNPVKPRVPGTVKACVVDLYAQAGGPKRVMVRLGVGESQVYAFADPESPEQISFARVAALTDQHAPAAAEYLAALAGGVFLPMPRATTPIGALTAEAIRQQSIAAAELVDALADGRVSRAEALEALPELDAALRAWAQLRSSIAEIASTEGSSDQ